MAAKVAEQSRAKSTLEVKDLERMVKMHVKDPSLFKEYTNEDSQHVFLSYYNFFAAVIKETPRLNKSDLKKAVEEQIKPKRKINEDFCRSMMGVWSWLQAKKYRVTSGAQQDPKVKEVVEHMLSWEKPLRQGGRSLE